MAGPPVRHSSNHFSFFVEVKTYQVGSSGSQLFSLRDRYGEQGAPLGPHGWDQSLGVFSSQQQADVVCTVKLRGPCCASFMRGQQKKKKKRVFASSNVNFFTKKRNLQHLCRSPLALVFLHLGPHALLFSCVTRFLGTKGYAAALLALMETVLLRFAGLGTDDNIICSVVSNSFRPLVVESGDEPEAILWHRILARRCHRSIGDNIFGARRRVVDDGELKLPKHCGTGFVFALLQPWHRQEQKLIFTSLAVACGFSWSMCLSNFARGRMPSSIPLFR